MCITIEAPPVVVEEDVEGQVESIDEVGSIQSLPSEDVDDM